MPFQYLPYSADDQWESVPLPEFEPDGPTVLVVKAELLGSDSEEDTYRLTVCEYERVIPNGLGPDLHDGLVREGGSAEVARHYTWTFRDFWDAMNAALTELGVAGRAYGREMGPVWHSDGYGFYTYVKEVQSEG